MHDGVQDLAVTQRDLDGPGKADQQGRIHQFAGTGNELPGHVVEPRAVDHGGEQCQREERAAQLDEIPLILLDAPDDQHQRRQGNQQHGPLP